GDGLRSVTGLGVLQQLDALLHQGVVVMHRRGGHAGYLCAGARRPLPVRAPAALCREFTSRAAAMRCPEAFFFSADSARRITTGEDLTQAPRRRRWTPARRGTSG